MKLNKKQMSKLMDLLKALKQAQIEFNNDLKENNSTKGSLDRLEYAQSDIYEWVENNIKIDHDDYEEGEESNGKEN